MSHRLRTRLRKLEAIAPLEEPPRRVEIACLGQDEEFDGSAYPDDVTVLVIRSQGEEPHVE